MNTSATPQLAAPKTPATEKDREFALGLYLVLAALFVSSLITCNLAFRKFFAWTLPGLDYTFEASVGLLPYPLTFLVTDLISEVYGRKRADDVVKAGLVASLLTLGVITLAGAAPATAWSPVTDGEFDHVFGQTALAVGASMAAYLLAQFLDVRIFHFWKMHGRPHALGSQQPFDHPLPVRGHRGRAAPAVVGEIEWGLFGALLVNGFGFKVLVAAVDTPLVYLGAGWFRRRFGLEPGQEIAL